jgi:prephenate dehydrogenase
MAAKTDGTKRIGVIGLGRFGRLMIRYLAQDFTVTVYDRRGRKGEIEALGGMMGSLPETCRCDVVIPAVPISAMQEMLRRMADRLRPEALVVDVCSVKVYPVRWMRRLLPDSVAILATHPMFGPDSAAASLKGRKIVLCPERIERASYEKMAVYLKSKGLVVIESTPDAHDRQIAVSLALTHFIGRSLYEFGAVAQEVDTEGYQRLLHTLEVVTHDTWQLFADMYHYNPYAGREMRDFLSAADRIAERLAARGIQIPPT